MLKKVKLKRVSLEKGVEEREEYVVQEEHYVVKVDGAETFKLVAVPEHILEAGVGRMLGEGLIDSADDIESYFLDGSVLEFKLKSKDRNDGKARKKLGNIKVERDFVFECMKRMVEKSEKWRLTGGVHAAALYDAHGKMLYFAEDVGKITAVDKVIGMAALAKRDLSNTIIVSTGRIVGGIVNKIVRAGVPIVVSRSAPLHSSIEVAQKEGITLVCFARGNRMNIYTHGERIILP